MFEPEFALEKAWSRQSKALQPWESQLQRGQVRRVQLLYWKEHCLECAPPDCYYSCTLYEPRQDKRCARFEYGIYPNGSVAGLLGFGADIRFRKWGKLGTELYSAGLSPALHNAGALCDRVCAQVVTALCRLTNPFNLIDRFGLKPRNPQRTGYKAYAYVRDRALELLSTLAGSRDEYDAFVVECLSFEKRTFNLIVEYRESEICSRFALQIKEGKNYHEIVLGRFKGTSNPLRGSLNLYPENDQEVRVAFTWLDFVQKKSVLQARAEVLLPAEKVKCVAWDLDNTMWRGVLIEDGKDIIRLREEAIRLVRALDERGIIQSIISKNDHAEAMDVLRREGLDEYFVYPMINWDPKSENVKRLADALNINVDAVALVDDSPFERAEVKAVIQQCRVYDEKQIPNILTYPEFDMPVTEESRVRRKSYLAEMERERTLKASGGDYESFLRSCRMEMRIFSLIEEAQIIRCLELIQRSNQLNLSTRRYKEEEFRAFLMSHGMLCVGFQCKDRFGDYGIVGFARVDEGSDEPCLLDLVISCRVAQKMVERTLLEWIAVRERQRGYRVLRADFAKTKRNGPLRSVFASLPFEVLEEDDTLIRMQLPLERMNELNDIVKAVVDLTEAGNGTRQR